MYSQQLNVDYFKLIRQFLDNSTEIKHIFKDIVVFKHRKPGNTVLQVLQLFALYIYSDWCVSIISYSHGL
uniref:Uncharacterized protein n=1 Tax=Spironucleus salmonicida TaxID=348837 RepID=V6LR36_9EUKA|eukprot:EST46156.1 Hypothetical protein SS50377_13748 [Spironucleus salmonicida]